jgi:hypothetical protein
MSITLLGIRHHGPGSARSVREALETLQPDMILVEGPPDAEAALPLLAHPEMKPPVALLIYLPDEPRRAVYYPFAVYSPEWQAIHYGLSGQVPVRLMDLPQSRRMALALAEEQAQAAALEPGPPSGTETPAPGEDGAVAPDGTAPGSASVPDAAGEMPSGPSHPPPDPRQDPLGALAAAAGYSDGERWWEHMVEHRRESRELFQGILEAMTALRERLPPREDPVEDYREAWMRQTVRAAQKEGFQRIAVVCGAWHAPALAQMPPVRADTDLLKRLPKAVKVQATWIPWTYSRLCCASGYGAGVESPGWYDHLWRGTDRVATRWMARVAHLFREQDLDASSAHLIEAVRLAEALAALRDRPLPGLAELNEATRTVLCFGDDAPMRLIREKLIISERLGRVPDDTPMVPLQQDLAREQKRLRLPAEAAPRDHDLDLRKPTDLDRSRLLHRLNLLGVPWGETRRGRGAQGTFHEFWRLQWKPELAVALIEAGRWGNSIPDAATALVLDGAGRAPDLPALTDLADEALLADLPEAIGHLMAQLESASALASDVGHLMDTLPRMAEMLRYATVRQVDKEAVGHLVDGLVARICIGLPGACASLNDDAAEEMFTRVEGVNRTVRLLRNEEHRAAWDGVLRQVGNQHGLHGLLAGRCCWLLLDAGALDAEEAGRRMGLALSTAVEPAQAAAWAEGFLRNNGQYLLLTDAVWGVLDGWVTGLPAETFTALMPLLRRTFSTFHVPERRKMGERVRSGPVHAPGHARSGIEFDTARAEEILPVVARLLGLEAPVAGG